MGYLKFSSTCTRYTYALPRCRTSQYRMTFLPRSVSLWNDLSDTTFDGVGFASFKGRANAFLLAYSQNLAVLQDFSSAVSISVERSLWHRIRWCGTGGFQRQGKCLFIGLAARSLFVSCCFPFLFIHAMGWYCGAGVFGLILWLSLSPSLALPTFFW